MTNALTFKEACLGICSPDFTKVLEDKSQGSGNGCEEEFVVRTLAYVDGRELEQTIDKFYTAQGFRRRNTSRGNGLIYEKDRGTYSARYFIFEEFIGVGFQLVPRSTVEYKFRQISQD